MLGLYWHIDRWRQSAAYTDMTLEEQGAYRNLLDEATLRDGALPNDERILARACGDPLRWRRVRAAVLAKFTLGDDNLWRHQALEKVLATSQKRIDKQKRYRDRLAAERNGDGNAGGNAKGHAPVTNGVIKTTDQDTRQEQAPSRQALPGSRARGARPAGLSKRSHEQHVPGLCEWVCLPIAFVEERRALAPGIDLLEWARAVREAWQHAALPADNSRPFDFWRERWREATAPPLQPTSRESEMFALFRRNGGRHDLEDWLRATRRLAPAPPTPRLEQFRGTPAA